MSLTAVATLDGLKALDTIEEVVGGRAALQRALQLADDPDDADMRYVLGVILDPRADTTRLSTLCQKAGIRIGDFLALLKRSQYAKMLVEVQTSIATQTPKVVDDVLVRAQPHYITCPACKGTLTVREDADRTKPRVPCEKCVNADGVPLGQVYTLPDLERQRTALELANLLPKKGPLVAIQQNNGASLGDASPAGFAKLLAAADDILRRTPPPPIVEAEAVSTTAHVDTPPSGT